MESTCTFWSYAVVTSIFCKQGKCVHNLASPMRVKMIDWEPCLPRAHIHQHVPSTTYFVTISIFVCVQNILSSVYINTNSMVQILFSAIILKSHEKWIHSENISYFNLCECWFYFHATEILFHKYFFLFNKDKNRLLFSVAFKILTYKKDTCRKAKANIRMDLNEYSIEPPGFISH